MQPTISTCCLFIALLLSAAIFSQQDNLIVLRPGPAEAPSKKIFIRLYNEQGRRIGKGHLLYGNDTVIMLRKRRSIHKYHVLTVTFIKTRRHPVGDIAIGTGVVAAFLAVSWVTSDPQDRGLSLPVPGTSTGTAAGMTIKRRTIWIYRDIENWKAVRKLFFNL